MDNEIHVTLLDLPQLLTYIPNHDREVWTRVTMGLKDEYGEAARDAWEHWSSSDSTYNKRDAATTWRSFKAGGGVTFGTVVRLAMDNGWKPTQTDMTAEDRKRLREEQAAARAAREAEVAADRAKVARLQDAIAAACQKIWAFRAETRGQSKYLDDKGVPGLAQVGYFNQSVMLWTDDQAEQCGVLTGPKVMEFFRKLPNPRPTHISFLHFSRGSICVPAMDGDGRLWSLQLINGTGVKLFPKHCRKSGCFHVLGDPDADLIAFAEGLATAASIRAATGWTVVIAFDAGNLPRVARTIRTMNRTARFVFCADRDLNSAGEKRAQEAADAVGNSVVVLPVFEEAA